MARSKKVPVQHKKNSPQKLNLKNNNDYSGRTEAGQTPSQSSATNTKTLGTEPSSRSSTTKNETSISSISKELSSRTHNDTSRELSSRKYDDSERRFSSTMKKRISKRKSLPSRRQTITEEYRSSYAINRFGSTEACTKNVYYEFRRLQKTTKLLIPKLSFSRLIREIMSYYLKDLRIQVTALQALQEAAEIHIVDIFGACNLVAHHAKRKTINNKDMALVTLLQKWTTGNPCKVNI